MKRLTGLFSFTKMIRLICPKILTSLAFMNCRTRLLFIFTALFILTGCSRNSVTKILKSKDVEYKLGMAEQYYANKKYNKAQILYEDLFPLLRNDPRFEDLYYKYAYCFYYQTLHLSSIALYFKHLSIGI